MLLFRVDGDSQIGTGHVMRCLALAQAWQDAGGEALFLMAASTPALEARLAQEGFRCRRIAREEETIEIAQQIRPACVVLDGYHFGAALQRAITAADLRLLVFDDYGHAGHYAADFVVNQNISASETLYQSREPHTQLLLGPKYVQLRREFLPWSQWPRTIAATGTKILVTLGGSDPENVTARVIRALPPHAEALVLIGGGNPHRQMLQTLRGTRARLEYNCASVAERMAWADVAVAAGGTTLWELAFMGLPAVILCLAENQRPGAECLDEAGFAQYLGWHGEVEAAHLTRAVERLLQDEKRRTAMSARGRVTVDGKGSRRLCQRLMNLPLRLRRARSEDCRAVWQCANEPETRAASFSSAPIAWPDHQRWFAGKLSDSACLFYVAVDANDSMVGQVRFEIKPPRRATISLGLIAEKRGSGWGKILLDQGLKALFRDSPAEAVDAFVKTANPVSARIFQQCGFRQERQVVVQGHSALHFVLERSKI